ncbi:hypothetical protein APASM_4480 [Actinosynnema pretiosum subsp. pretiosum]|nr:hypothetical protein APASM_4480 [Actinosynnema pretiosum subsp. pretiosum]
MSPACFRCFSVGFSPCFINCIPGVFVLLSTQLDRPYNGRFARYDPPFE